MNKDSKIDMIPRRDTATDALSRTQIWVTAGHSLSCDCTVIAQTLMQFLRRQGHSAQLVPFLQLYPDRENGGPIAGDGRCEYAHISHRFLHDLDQLWQHGIFWRQSAEMKKDFLILDNGSHCTAKAFELFLFADLPIFILDLQANGILGAKTFFKLCICKLLDMLFKSAETSLRMVIEDLQQHPPFSPTVFRQIRALQQHHPSRSRIFDDFISTFAPQLLLIHATPDAIQEFSDFYLEEGAFYFPQASSILGVVHKTNDRADGSWRRMSVDALKGQENQRLIIPSIIRQKMSALLRTA